MEAKDILGLDVGAKHTGIARGSNVARLAEPLMTVPTNKALTTINDYLKGHHVEAIVIGLPRNLAGDDTQQTSWLREWADKVKQEINTPLYWQDEALTSRMAALKLQTSKSKHQITDEHALAAAIILQDFLDTREAERIVI